LQNYPINPVPSQKHLGRRQRGYILLTLMLFVAFLGIAALAIVPTVAFQTRRDREEEMIHRGVQYSRAVRRYYKKFGRYPTRLEDLENTNNQRYLRKRYKDPITGKDFKLLHVGEVQMGMGSAIAGATQVSAMGTLNGQPSLNAQPPTKDKSDNATSDDAKTGDASSTDKSQPQPLAQATGPTGQNPQVFGGSAILGVTSTSKDKSIREFNKKKHYNEWQFVYDPSTDRGGLLTMPNQQSLQGGGLSQTGPAGQQQQVFGGFGGPQQQNSSFGQPSQFGQSPTNPNQQNPQPQQQ
jgi:type II secretory pathway pseudopilin PulG